MADLYQGFYIGVGGGIGWLDNGATNSPGDLGYEAIFDPPPAEDIDLAVETNYLAQRSLDSASGGAARIHAGMLWPIYNDDVRDTNDWNIFANASWGFELGYRYLQHNDEHTADIPFTDMVKPPEESFEQKTSHDVTTQAFEAQAVMRLPLTGESQWWGALALIGKAGVAYNMTDIDSRINFKDLSDMPLEDFNRSVKFSESHDEWLPVVRRCARVICSCLFWV